MIIAQVGRPQSATHDSLSLSSLANSFSRISLSGARPRPRCQRQEWVAMRPCPSGCARVASPSGASTSAPRREPRRGAQSRSASKTGQQRSSLDQLPPPASAGATVAAAFSCVFFKASREDRALRKRTSRGPRSGTDYVSLSPPHPAGVANPLDFRWTVERWHEGLCGRCLCEGAGRKRR